MEEETQPLLGVEGTTQKRPTPLPRLQIAILMLLHLAEPINSHCIYPFINQLIRELDITGGDEKKVGYYAGLIESIFFATEALFVFQWSRLSDHIGRKPVLLIGLGGSCVSIICFGLSRTFLTLVLSRSLVGMLNGNTGVMKSMMGGKTDGLDKHCGGIRMDAGLVVLGGHNRTYDRRTAFQTTRQVAKRVQAPFLGRVSIFFPCAVSALFSSVCFVVAMVYLKETVKKRRPSTESGVVMSDETDVPPPLGKVLTRPVVISIANYGVLALVEIAFLCLMPLFLSTPIPLGGLGLSPPAIGAILGGLGIADGVLQALFFARAIAAWGPKRVFQVGLSMFVPLYALYPIMSLYARVHGFTWVVWAMVGLQQLLLVVLDMSFGAIFLFVTSSAADNRLLGATNGIAQVVASVVRAVGPALSTSLFATSLERNWLGGYGVYAILIPFSVTLSLVSILLPREMWKKPGEEHEHED